ncbi:MAG: hypothetical protein U0704_12030 [Candidatus Eisenbacteria bacterium]
MKKLFSMTLCALAAFTSIVHAQGVGINGTGAAADTSAILDLSATNKGLLVPRMTAAQRAAIVLPATGLVVFQTDGTAGLYFNAGTSASPNWQPVGAGATSGQWSTSGSNIFYSSGNVGIQRSAPAARLDVLGGNWDVVNGEGDVRIGDADTRLKIGVATAGGGTGAVTIMEQGPVGAYNVLSLGTQGNKVLHVNGNTQRVGIGVDAPSSPLGFAPALGKKISLYPAGANDYGLGIASGRLQIFSDGSPAGDVAIGTDAAGVFTERFAVRNNGALAVGGSTGSAGQVLQSNGSGAAATWVTPAANMWALNGTNAFYNGGNVGIGTNTPNAPLGFPATLGRKITLYPGTLGSAGIGMSGNRVQIYSDNSNADVALGYDVSGTFIERFAFKPTGAMAVNGNAGTAGQVLQSNGSGAAATWVSPTNSAYNNFYSIESVNSITPAAYATQALPDMSQAFTLTGNARVTVDFSVSVYTPGCAFCAPTLAEVKLFIDGVEVHDWRQSIPNEDYGTISASLTRTLGAGAHTISLSGEPYTTSARFGSSNPRYANTMTIQVTPQ